MGIKKLIPLKDFFRNPEKTSFAISPNGEYLAFLMPWRNRLNIFVQKIVSDEFTRVTNATGRDIAAYSWINNNRLVYLQDKGGDENFRLYAVNFNGENPIDLTPFEKVKVEIIDKLEEVDDEMIIAMNKRDPRIFDVFRININSGEMKLIAENPGNVTGWLTDHNGKLRIATITDGVNISLLYREKESDNFEVITTTDFRETLSPVIFTFDNKFVYALSNIGRDKLALVKYDIKNNKELGAIYEHAEVDISDLIISKKRKMLTGVAFTTGKKSYHFFDSERENLQKELENLLSGYEVTIADMNKNEDKLLVRTYSDKSRGPYYFYDLNIKKLIKLADVSPWLREEELADMKSIKYLSRDGLTIHGYLTLPKDIKPTKLPIVVIPHGGPWARDVWGFDPEVQFLANRDYAVLQINFRSSTGYGRKFWEAGFKKWGKEMQNDITDGINWLIEQKIADPKRIGIYGGSYGGYATLAGLTFTPELYACGVDYVGVSNLFTLLDSIPPYWEPYLKMFYEMVGDPVKDVDLIKEISPIFNVDKIKAPLLIAQGANDPRVNKAESDQIVEALKKRGIDVPYIVKENEGHGFQNEENKFEFYEAMENFLAKHLHGKKEGK